MVGGFLLNNFIEYALMVERLENKREKTKLRKMVLYSSHDGTLLSLMYAMNVANGLLTPCAAAIIMEIYKKDKEYFVEFWYRNETTNEPYPLSIPKCGSNCTVQKFAEQYSNIRVKSWNEHQEVG
ncbi:hypothetical protein OESDEN_05146 [Oesophagostomum dentatum]|uniref:Histidine acid phosphatase n=1 Tax=Oesophagostomum dentatum TaxID=61180 RepID=A0A0B1TCA0_OESDE|nr:hypothetical protein OESDEN_05146 [Oesophagostomum dentatum]